MEEVGVMVVEEEVEVGTDPVSPPVTEEADSVVGERLEASATEPMEVDMVLPDHLPLHMVPLMMITQAAEVPQGGRPMTTMTIIKHHANSENYVVMHMSPPQCVRLVLQ